MTKTIGAAATVLALAAGAIVVTAAPAAAATTYHVTSSACLGPGTLVDAIGKANANPGADIIKLDVAVTDWYLGDCKLPSGRTLAARITGPVTIDGQGKSITSMAQWLSPDGSLNNKSRCPSRVHGVIFLQDPSGGFEIGTPSADNTNVQVTLKNLTMDGLLSAAVVNNKASLTLEGVTLNNILDTRGCSQAPIEVQSGANLSVSASRFTNNWNWAPVFGAVASGVIQGGSAGNLAVQNSLFQNNNDSGAITWSGAAGSKVNIVTNQFFASQGISIIGDPGPVTAKIVNTAIGFIGFYPASHIVASGNAAVTLQASTVAADTSVCDSKSIEGPCLSPLGVLGTEGGGTIALQQSAVGVADPGDSLKPADVVADGAGFTADAQSYVTPVPVQDAAALQAKFAQPGLLTDPPALPTINDPEYYGSAAAQVTPLLGTQQHPGVLLDVIPDATCTAPFDANKLINPIDQTCITKDALGNDRWDTGNSKRNIGAVQLSLAPHLTLVRTGNQLVEVKWTRPLDPQSGPVTGYGLLYRPTGSVGPWTRINVTGPNTLGKVVTGLTNGTKYDFEVVGVNVIGDGPPSNVVQGTPLGGIGTPVPKPTQGNAKVTLTWPTPTLGGHTLAGYSVVYRPKGSVTWLKAGTVTAPRITVTGLRNGTTYQFGVTAMATDNAVSKLGVANAVPYAVLPLRITGARPATSPLPRSGTTTVVAASSTLPQGSVHTFVRCTATRSLRGDLRNCTFKVAATGAVTVTTYGRSGVTVTVTQQAMPNAGQAVGYHASAPWSRTWQVAAR